MEVTRKGGDFTYKLTQGEMIQRRDGETLVCDGNLGDKMTKSMEDTFGDKAVIKNIYDPRIREILNGKTPEGWKVSKYDRLGEITASLNLMEADGGNSYKNKDVIYYNMGTRTLPYSDEIKVFLRPNKIDDAGGYYLTLFARDIERDEEYNADFTSETTCINGFLGNDGKTMLMEQSGSRESTMNWR